MKAVIFQRFGETDVLEWAELPKPIPGPDEIRVRVRAFSINPFECQIREGAFRMLTGGNFPMIAGHDIAGEIEAVGDGVQRFQIGDPVFTMRKAFSGGAQAEFAVVPESGVALIPGGLSMSDAGVVPLAALTAWQSLYELGNLEPGQRVLVNGASGGVGIFAVQFARVTGAEVTAVCSEANQNRVRKLGAARVIDYKVQDPTQITGFDLVFDVVTNLPFNASTRMLKRGGVWVCTGMSRAYVQARILALVRRRPVRLVTVKANGEQLEQIGALIAAGKVEVVVEETYPVSEITQAHAKSATGRVRGKIAINIP